MTDDTDSDEHENERAVSLPLIDTYAALTAEIDAKADRIERLESELDRRYLDPADGDPETAAPAGETADTGTRSHEDWDPATDPLEDTGTATADGDHEGVRPTVDAAGSAPDREAPTADSQREESADTGVNARDSGISPVKTASAADAEAGSGESDDGDTDESFGVGMETSSDLTGGSLDGSPLTENAESEPDSDGVDEEPPDPTADRGERLSRLVRRAELREEGEVVEAFVEGIDALDEVTREMLAHYREVGDATPLDAHVAAGGSGERRYAYARNRTLRKAGVIEHDGAGRYRYALPDLVREAFDGNAAAGTVTDAVEAIETATDID